MERFRKEFEKLKRWTRPPRTLQITPAGKALIGLTLGIGFGALNTGNNLLYLLLGAALSTITLSGILSERCLNDIEVKRLGADTPFAGEFFLFRYAVRRKKGTAFALTFEEVDSELRGSARLALLTSAELSTASGPFTASHRGPCRLTAIRVTTLYPLGIFAKSRTIDVEETFWVYPKRISPESLPLNDHGSNIKEGGRQSARDGNGDLAGLRELQNNEDARRIHWAKSAMVGKLLRTEREREERKHFWLEVKGALGPDLERQCEEATAQATHLLARGVEVGLKTNVSQLRPSSDTTQLRRILNALALVGYERIP